MEGQQQTCRNNNHHYKKKNMETVETTKITVEAMVNAPVKKVWNCWTSPEHIIQWCSPSAEWHTPRAENDLRVGGKFLSRMEARDGSMGFDFGGVYDEVVQDKKIAYTIGDGRKVSIRFEERGNQTFVSETFEAESINSIDMQRGGWQAIMDSFKNYVQDLK
jgi:uncharacterized protein YndB with AHSA1/START domain